MRIQDHIGKITWTVLDKGLFITYGMIRMLQVSRMQPSEFGLFALLDALVLTIGTLSDNFSLQSIIRFGSDNLLRPKINALSMISHTGLSMGLALIIFFSKTYLSLLFSEPRIIQVATYLPLLCLLNLPRIMSVKFLLRDTKMKEVFITNSIWFGSMIAVTFYFLSIHAELSLLDMIWITGIGTSLSSLTGLFFTFSSIDIEIPDKDAIHQFYRFGGYQVSWALPSTIMKQLDLYFVQYFFGATIVGIFQSAKTLFRFFEALIDGIGGLYYPAMVRIHARNDSEAERSLTSKMLSFSILSILVLVIIMNAGIGEWAVHTFLSTKYSLAFGHFQWLMISAITLPMNTMAIVYIIYDDMPALLFNSIISCLAGITASVLIGIVHAESMVSFGTIFYNVSFAIFGIRFAINKQVFTLKDFFRAIPDIFHFAKSGLKKYT